MVEPIERTGGIDMEIATFSLTGIYWNDHPKWDGKAELTVHANLVGRNSPVTLKFEDLDQPAEMQALIDAFGLYHHIKLVTNARALADTEPSNHEAMAATPTVGAKSDVDGEATSNGSQPDEAGGQAVGQPATTGSVKTNQSELDEPGKHLQAVNQAQDFDPEKVGADVAKQLATTTKTAKDQPALTLPTALPREEHAQQFTATDFENQPETAADGKKATTFNASGQKIDTAPEDEGNPGATITPDNDLFGQAL